jgi:hypothetical protein
MGSTSKKRQTMAKFAREKAVKERRALKLEKRHAAAREARAAKTAVPADGHENAGQPDSD